MSTQTNLIQFKKYLLSLEQSGCYDVEKYTHSLMFQTSQLAFFFCQLVKDHNVDHTFYHVHHKPKIHTLAYFNIGRGYPKELQDGHWCYVLKDFGYKMLIVPCTSIKENSSAINENFEMEIETMYHHEKMHCRMQLSDMRMVDLQRLDERKPIYEVCTNKEDIKSFIKEKIFDECKEETI